MKVLLDANISWKLVNILTPAFDECAHVKIWKKMNMDYWRYMVH
jgi:predicted nuclease of predicted toxin-antitoxin system